jgi:hypothetical protein
MRFSPSIKNNSIVFRFNGSFLILFLLRKTGIPAAEHDSAAGMPVASRRDVKSPIAIIFFAFALI